MAFKQKRTKNTAIYVLLIFLAGVFHLLEQSLIEYISTFSFCMVYAIYGGLILFWLLSTKERLLPSRFRSYLIAAAVCMLMFLILRSVRYRVFSKEYSEVYTWYLYYIPIVLIPTFFLMSCIHFCRFQEGKYREWMLLIPSAVICVAILLNNFHHLAFYPNDGVTRLVGRQGTYTRGMLYYMTCAWVGLLMVGGVIYLVIASKRVRDIQKARPPLCMLALLVLSHILHDIMNSTGIRWLFELPEIYIFGMIGVFEACIRSRLMPYNDNYLFFFESLDIPAVITDKEFLPVTGSAHPLSLTETQMQSALHGSIYTDKHTKLSGMEIVAGYVFWTEDEEEMQKENARLASANELMSEENNLIAAENRLKEQKARLEAQSKIYERIAAELYSKQKKIEELMESTTPGTPQFREVLAKCCLLNAYSKRKGNLLLLSEETFPKRNRELFLSLQESVRFLRCFHIEAAVIGEEEAEFTLLSTHRLYDSFQSLIESYMPYITKMTVSISPKGVRVVVDTEEFVRILGTKLPVDVKIMDGLTYLTIRVTQIRGTI